MRVQKIRESSFTPNHLWPFEALEEKNPVGLAQYQAETAGKPLQEVESTGTRSPGWQPQARKCLAVKPLRS
jgi:hypothetical protein